jgi:hypothetical protein
VRFIRWAVETFGSPAPGDDGLIVIAVTQQELARAYQDASPGTVAWYVSRLVRGHEKVPAGGQLRSPLVASGSPHSSLKHPRRVSPGR